MSDSRRWFLVRARGLAMQALALSLLCGVMPRSVRAEDPPVGLDVLIGRAREQIAHQEDQSCKAVRASYSEVYEALRHHYHDSRGEDALTLGGLPSHKLPVTLRAADQLLLQRFIQDAAMHSARCAQHDVSPAAYSDVHEWITHASLLIFRLVAPDKEQRLGLLESVLSEGGLSDTQERLIEVLRHDMVARGDVRGEQELARVINRERLREREARSAQQARQRARDRRTREGYVALIVVLTLCVLLVVMVLARRRLTGIHLSVPAGRVDVCAPYRMHGAPRDLGVLPWSDWRRAWLDDAMVYGVVGLVCMCVGGGVLMYMLSAPIRREGYVHVLLGCLIFMAGAGVLSGRLWSKAGARVKVPSVERVRWLRAHQEVLVALAELQREHYAILLRHPVWRPWREMSAHKDDGVYDGVPGPGRAAILLWRGLWMMRTWGRAPALSCTQELCELYVESRDEWGNAFELYWDALRTCRRGVAHVELCESAWRGQWAWLDELESERDAPVRFTRMLEAAMLCGRGWRIARWEMLWRDRANVHPRISEVIWTCERGASQELFWVDESLAYVTREMDVVVFDEDARIGVASVAQLSVRDCVVWGEHFADHEIVSELEQLERVRSPLELPVAANVLVFKDGRESWRASWHDVLEVVHLGYLAAYEVVVCIARDGDEVHVGVVSSYEPRYAHEPLCALHTLHPVLLAELRRIVRLDVYSSGELTMLYAIGARQVFVLSI